jgi:protein SCO1
MNRFHYTTATLALLAFAATAGAQAIPDNVGQSSAGLPPALQNVGFSPQLNSQIPLDTMFVDESGREVRLRDYFDRKPVLLALVYYSCPMLCDQVEQGVVGSLKMLSLHPGRDYQVIFVSFDAREKPELAARKKETVLAHYGHPETASAWHFLTGSPDSIAALTKAVNFRYALDPQTNIFAHASGILLLTPEGRISRYFYGVEFPARDVRLGLVDASAGKIGTPVDHLLLYCFQYNPATARYSATVLKIVRLGGLLTIFTILGGILIYRRRDLKMLTRNTNSRLPGENRQGAQ